MYADWLHQLQLAGGTPLMNDMFQGAEAYLEMWERADGVPPTRCLTPTDRLDAHRHRADPPGRDHAQALLYRAGQPVSRPGRSYRTACPVAAALRCEAGVSTRVGRISKVAIG